MLGQLNKYIKQNQNSICNTLLWLVENCQLENGSFKENSDYQPIKLQVRKPSIQISNSLIYKFEFCSHPILGVSRRENTRNPLRKSCHVQAKNMKVQKIQYRSHE